MILKWIRGDDIVVLFKNNKLSYTEAQTRLLLRQVTIVAAAAFASVILTKGLI
jgi:hypothetical protein